MKYSLLVLWFVFSLTLILAGCGGGDSPSPAPSPSPSKVQIGTTALPEHTYSWSCTNGAELSDMKAAQPFVSAKRSSVCTVVASTKCGTASSMVNVKVYKKLPSGELVEVK